MIRKHAHAPYRQVEKPEDSEWQERMTTFLRRVLAGTALGNVMGVKEEDTDSAAPSAAGEEEKPQSNKFSDHFKKKQDELETSELEMSAPCTYVYKPPFKR